MHTGLGVPGRGGLGLMEPFEVKQARRDLELAIANADLVKQLEKVGTPDEMGALGWRFLMGVDYDDAWQHTGCIWIKDNGHFVTHTALTNDPPGQCGFIKLLSFKEFKALIVEEASD